MIKAGCIEKVTHKHTFEGGERMSHVIISGESITGKKDNPHQHLMVHTCLAHLRNRTEAIVTGTE